MYLKKHLTVFALINIFIVSLFYASCKNQLSEQELEAREDSIEYVNSLKMQEKIEIEVKAFAETKPVDSEEGEDAADDPAVWINKSNPEKSVIIGTNKKAGLNTYFIDGTEIGFYDLGKVNNIDVRQNVRFSDSSYYDIIVGSNRTDNSIEVLTIDTNTFELKNIAKSRVETKVGEVYGITLYHSKDSDKLYAFISGKNGNVEQFEIIKAGDSTFNAVSVRLINIESITEGLVADDELGFLYVAEENVGIWKVNADPVKDLNKRFIPSSSAKNNDFIAYDIEGLALYSNDDSTGYIIASSQGSFSYAVFDRISNNYLFSFKIVDGDFDGAEETDGIEVVNHDFGNSLSDGIFIAQDGFNYDGEKQMNQNFKIVSWKDIMLANNEFISVNFR